MEIEGLLSLSICGIISYGVSRFKKWLFCHRLRIAFLGLVDLLCVSCSGTAGPLQDSTPNASSAEGSSQIVQERPVQQGNLRNAAPYTGDGGKGIIIVVPAPAIQNHSVSEAWMPQFFQDTITGDFVRYSAMTVVDRSNEQLVLAEQNVSASGNYSDDDYIKMGNLTNAQYIVAGKINKIAGNYAVSFRINHTETNEIRAAFDKTYSLREIETGLASKEVIRELLAGMGIELTEAGEKSLLTVQDTQVRASAQLAKGMAAERSDNIVEALSFLSEALDADATKAEANKHIQSFFVDIPAGTIRERANYALAQKEKWKKIFSDLNIYPESVQKTG
jgi:CRISPR/Cas system CSM-associated protein Csm2 small subunit